VETVWNLIVVAHLVGMAALVGGWLTQVRAARPRVPAVMVWGAAAQVVTGPVLVGLASSHAVHHSVDNTKIAVKLVIALAVFAVAHLARHRELEADDAAAGGDLGPAPLAVGPAAGGAAVATAAGTTTWPLAVHVAGGLALVNVLIAVLWG
jgi:hypothetical protein